MSDEAIHYNIVLCSKLKHVTAKVICSTNLNLSTACSKVGTVLGITSIQVSISSIPMQIQ